MRGQLKRSRIQEARIKMYLDRNIQEATARLTEIQEEKADLEARLARLEDGITRPDNDLTRLLEKTL